MKRYYSWRELEDRPVNRAVRETNRLDHETGRNLVARLFPDSSVQEGEDLYLALLRNEWPELAGPLSRYSLPVSLKGGKLTVRVEKPVYAQEFTLYSRQILESVRKLLKQSVTMRTEVGPIPWDRATKERNVKRDVADPGDLPEENKILLKELEKRRRESC